MFGLKIFKYILKIPTLILVVAFVVLNRQEATLYISPISDPLVLPLWIMGLVLFGLGFIVGALLLWLNNFPVSKELRKVKKQLKEVTKEKDELTDSLHDQQIDGIIDNE